MKKSLLALAVLGAFAGTASAQSSVTIFGLVDLGIYKGSGDAVGYSVAGVPVPFSGLAAGGFPAGEAWHIQQAAGSRLGFRGTEDLGGGLSAQFWVEHRFTPDTGIAASPSFWQGRTYVQLTSAAAGSVYLGREYTPAFWPAVKSDPFGWDGVGQVGAMHWGGYLTPGASGTAAGVRSANTIGYKSPNLGGLTVQAAVGLGEGPGVGRVQGFNVEYGAGPIYAALGYEKVADGFPDGSGVLNLALHYDFGFAKLIGYYAAADVNDGTAGGTLDSKVFSLAASAPLGGGRLKAQFTRVDIDGIAPNSSKIGLGFDYPLSRRTNVYVDFARAGVSDVTSDDKFTKNAFAVGVKHTF